MAEQLRFEGDPIFEPPSFNELIKDLYVGPILGMLKDDYNRMAFGTRIVESHPRHKVQHLFEPAPQCHACLDIGEEWLSCHNDAGHSGPHYDGYNDIEWSQR